MNTVTWKNVYADLVQNMIENIGKVENRVAWKMSVVPEIKFFESNGTQQEGADDGGLGRYLFEPDCRFSLFTGVCAG